MKELKFHKDGGFDIEIIDIYEEGNQLRVKTRCPYGEDNLGLSLKAKYIDRDGIPQWRKRVKKALIQKYGKHIGEGKTDANKKELYEDFRGVINIEDLDKPNKKPK